MRKPLILALGLILSSQAFAMSLEEAAKCDGEAFGQAIESRVDEVKSKLSSKVGDKFEKKFAHILLKANSCEEIFSGITQVVEKLEAAVNEVDEALKLK